MKTRKPLGLGRHLPGRALLASALMTALVLALGYIAQGPARAAEVPPAAAESPLPPAVTIVSSDITTDTTWTLANSPYQVTADITVQTTATLTLEPGVEVRFGRYRGLTVRGRLTALGTASQPITLTGTSQEPGGWDGIRVEGSESAPNTGCALSYVTLEYGGGYYANLYVSYATVTVTNSIIRYSSRDGIYGWYGGVTHISNTTIVDNGGYAIQFTDGSVNPVLGSLTASGNGYDAVALGYGTLRGDHTWEYVGLPYIVAGDQTVDRGSSLTIQPGVEARFQQNRGLIVRGKLSALGTVSQPITLTATSPQAGWWEGLRVDGGAAAPAGAALSHVAVEYGGGYYANIYVSYGQAAVSHGIIRNSSKDGVYAWYGGAGSAIQFSQIINNAGYGVRNVETSRTLLASNNWWGSNSGPTVTETGCNPGGAGSTVSAGVEFRPFLTMPGADPGPLAPSEARLLSLALQRWFVPADGVIRAWVTITLRDGSGQPLPGRRVRLQSTLGKVVDGDISDVQGQSLAYVTSTTPGDAELTANLDSDVACESATSPSATITFTPVDTGADLLPEAAAPYLNHGIQIDPEPITQGVPTRLRARLQNPNNFPISVNATFGIAQYGLGLAFGPVGEVQNQIIPPNTEGLVEVVWTPPVSGRYCLRVEYSYQALAAGVTAAQRRSGSAQRNVDVEKGSTSSPREKDALKKGRDSVNALKKGKLVTAIVLQGPAKAGRGFVGFAIPGYLFSKILDFNFDTWGQAAAALEGDPPRQDYTILATLDKFSFTPLQAEENLPAARAEATNDLMVASLDLTAKLRAMAISLDRYAGASRAGNEEWASRQASALLYYKKQAGAAMMVVADKMDAMLQELRSEGIEDVTVTAEAIRAYQDRLRTQGFNAEEVQAARAINLTDQDIEAVREERIAASPDQVAGSVTAAATQVSAGLRTLGRVLTTEPPILGGGGRRAAQGQAGGVNLSRVYATAYSFQVGNPLTQTATIRLTVRRLNIPPDWIVAMAPMTVTLPAGSQTTVAVTVEPGSATVAGTQPQVAIEGYANGQLLGGVALDVMVPREVAFDGKLRVYLPAAIKSFSAGW